ncbi:MAG: SUMF1/EgtB/PvdO family nonheme iron enzyme [Chitinispirillales bacterium]|jgi:hypothetical protein|nr:SUMF1/EgtB/PvdO family nonheme iron enzyme [Chitinispirillales bacterium]
MKKNNLSKNKKSAGSVNSSANNGKPADGGKKRSDRSVVLLILLILFLLFLLSFIGDKIFDLGIFGKWGTGQSTGAAVVDPGSDTLSISDSLGLVDTADLDSLARAEAIADSIARAEAAADSLAKAQAAADSITLARAAADSHVRARIVADSLTRVRAITDSLARIQAVADSIALVQAAADSLAKAQAVADSIARAEAVADSLAGAQAVADSLARARATADSLAVADSARIADSLSRVADPCARDTIALWVQADPSGGLHRQPIAVRLTANKEGSEIEWSLNPDGGWNVYDGTPISISSAANLYFRAEDRCGRRMDTRVRRYEFDLTDRTQQCPHGMEYVNAGGREFCIDNYLWPNRKGGMPQSFVSLFQAMDSCFSVRKRLCTSDEWTAACAGPAGLQYPYGNSYEQNTCVTSDTTARRSGSNPECRSYFEVFDMSGNLAEWTGTHSRHDRSFNYVMGGFWASGSHSRCTDSRDSYFSQNRHNPVGFRCCRDAVPQRNGQPARQKGSGR